MKQWLAAAYFLAALSVASGLRAQVTLDEMTARAEAGDTMAQLSLGMAYFNGVQGLAPNHTEAQKWFRKAAEQGNASAQYNLGMMYNYGDSLPKDAAQALKWIRKAADQGLSQAEVIIGISYDRGTGVPKDADEAVKWMTRAAAQGEPYSRQYLEGLNFAGVIKPAVRATWNPWIISVAGVLAAVLWFFSGKAHKGSET